MPSYILSHARKSKKDEFYTLYEDVKFELDHYIDYFKDKVVYCPCDNDCSSFVRYFNDLKNSGIIKELLYTCIENGVSFDSCEAMDNYAKCDVIVTNPPFSLWRKFISLVASLDNKFIVWGTNNSVSYKEVTSMLKNDAIRIGYTINKTCNFEIPIGYNVDKSVEVNGHYYCKVPSVSVFTNLDVKHNDLNLTRKYDENFYHKYDNFNAINVNKTKDIPYDYEGTIGVPITYLGYHDSSKYEILGVFNNFIEDIENGRLSGERVSLSYGGYTRGPIVNGYPLYVRLIIRKRKNHDC